MDAHWEQVSGGSPRRAHAVLLLRTIAAMAIVVTLTLCMKADHASIVVLVWIISLVAAALLVVFTLASRPRWLSWLASAGRQHVFPPHRGDVDGR